MTVGLAIYSTIVNVLATDSAIYSTSVRTLVIGTAIYTKYTAITVVHTKLYSHNSSTYTGSHGNQSFTQQFCQKLIQLASNYQLPTCTYIYT